MKKKGNKKMPIQRQELIDNPIPSNAAAAVGMVSCTQVPNYRLTVK